MKEGWVADRAWDNAGYQELVIIHRTTALGVRVDFNGLVQLPAIVIRTGAEFPIGAYGLGIGESGTLEWRAFGFDGLKVWLVGSS